MPWIFQACTNVGGREEQQDNYFLYSSEDNSKHLLLVADGAGGHRGGAEASRTVTELAASRAETIFSSDAPEESLMGFCMEAHERIQALSQQMGGMSASTIVLLYLHNREAYWAHVGDSRLYFVQDGEPYFQTRDHSLLQLQRDTRPDTPQDQLPPANKLYMCLGPPQSITPESGASVLGVRDRVLLCSDGFWGQLPMAEVLASLSENGLSEQWCETWVEKARGAGGQRGDNITVIMGEWHEPQDSRGFWATLYRRLRALTGF